MWAGRERRFTIGSWPDWRTAAARIEAADLKRRIDRGDDPLADIEADRTAPTVADLCERYAVVDSPRKRATSRADDERNIRLYVLPALKHCKVAEVKVRDIDGLHRQVTKKGATLLANRVIALVETFNWRSGGAGERIIRRWLSSALFENKRTRYLTGDELKLPHRGARAAPTSAGREHHQDVALER